MITNTYICDICKKSVGESELFPVHISLTVPKRPNTYSQKLLSYNRDICKECLEDKGIITERPEGESEQSLQLKNNKTIESKFVELLQELGVIFEQ